MINKITFLKTEKIYVTVFFLLLLFVLYFIGVKFAYIGSNYYFKLNSRLIDRDIVIVALDDKTINSKEFKRYQDINRSDYADLLRKISYDTPKAIFTDVVFSNSTQDDKKILDLLKKNDNLLFNTEVIEGENGRFSFLENVIIPEEHLGYPNVNSFNVLNNYINFAGESDIKNIMPVYDSNILPAPFALYNKVHKQNDFQYGKNNIQLGNTQFPLANHGFNINFFTDNYPQVSFIDVLEGNVPSDFFKDKVVFIGATAKDIHDLFLSPYNPTNFIPGVIILANAYNTLTASKIV